MLAYLDPGSGSLFIQLIAGGLAGLATVFVTFRRRISAWFRRKPEPIEEHATNDA